MALTPQQRDTLAQPVVEVYNSIEEELMANVIRHLQDIDDINQQNVSIWQIKQMESLGLLNETNLRIIQKRVGLANSEMNKALYDAGVTSISVDDAALSSILKLGAALSVPPAVSASPGLLTIMQSFQAQALNTLNLTNMTLLNSASQMYTNIVNNVTGSVLAGTRTVQQAIRSTISQWSEIGLPALIDKANRRWSPEAYVRMVTITTTGNVANQMQDERMKQWGIDLVEVSSHIGARELCAPYQGKIYATAPHNKYPNLYTDTSYGQAAGLFGINCGHNKYPYVEGYSTQKYYPYPTAENDRVYAESQEQRKIERSIRKAKMRKRLLEEVGDTQGAKQAGKLLRKRQENMRKFIEETGRTRRRDREQIV